MTNSVIRWAAAATLLATPLAAHAGGYGYGDEGYRSSGYGSYGYDNEGSGRYGRYGYGYQGRGYGYGREGYGYGSSPWSAPARYCREHLAFHERQAWLYDHGAYDGWEGRREMEEDHARFHYSHPGSWRCMYQGWPSG